MPAAPYHAHRRPSKRTARAATPWLVPSPRLLLLRLRLPRRRRRRLPRLARVGLHLLRRSLAGERRLVRLPLRLPLGLLPGQLALHRLRPPELLLQPRDQRIRRAERPRLRSRHPVLEERLRVPRRQIELRMAVHERLEPALRRRAHSIEGVGGACPLPAVVEQIALGDHRN